MSAAHDMWKGEVLDALRAAADAKAAYWDSMEALEQALRCEDPIDSVNNFLVDRVDTLAINVNVPGDVDWIDQDTADEVAAEVKRLIEESAWRSAI
jgi:hypothetical protein